jgi:hypothetical protein
MRNIVGRYARWLGQGQQLLKDMCAVHCVSLIPDSSGHLIVADCNPGAVAGSTAADLTDLDRLLDNPDSPATIAAEFPAVEGESVGLGEREPAAEGTAIGVDVGGGEDDGGNGNDGGTGNAAGAKGADTGRQTSDWFGYWDGKGGGRRICPPAGFRGYGTDTGGRYGKCTYGKGGGGGGGIGPYHYPRCVPPPPVLPPMPPPALPPMPPPKAAPRPHSVPVPPRHPPTVRERQQAHCEESERAHAARLHSSDRFYG